MEIEKYINKALEITEITGQGEAKWRIDGTSDYFENFEVYLEIINCNLEMPELSKYSEPFKKIFIQDGIAALKKEGKNKATNEELKEKIKEIIKKREHKPLNSYKVLFMLNIQQDKVEKKVIRFFKKEFIDVTNNLSIKKSEFEKYLNDISYYFVNSIKICTILPNMSIFQLEENAINEREALNQGFDNIEKFRDFINAFYQFNHTTVMQFGKRELLNKILPSPGIGVFDKDGNYKDFDFPLFQYDYRGINIKKGKINFDKIETFSQQFVQEDLEIDNLIISCIERFGSAFDSLNWFNIYLHLWQILELIAFPLEKETQKERTIKNGIKRINLIFNQHPYIKDILDCLYKRRNELVHQGIFPEQEGLIQVNLLKTILMHTTRWLISERKAFSSLASLEEFYIQTLTSQ